VDDAKIRRLVDDPDNGRWKTVKGRRMFTPNMGIFDKIQPMELAKYFDGSEKELLNMP